MLFSDLSVFHRRSAKNPAILIKNQKVVRRRRFGQGGARQKKSSTFGDATVRNPKGKNQKNEEVHQIIHQEHGRFVDKRRNRQDSWDQKVRGGTISNANVR